jgi:hypothetical protein
MDYEEIPDAGFPINQQIESSLSCRITDNLARDRSALIGYPLVGGSGMRQRTKLRFLESESMFVVELTEVARPGVSVFVRASTLDGATGFVREFCGIEFGMVAGWEERDGRYVMDVLDWLDCWFADPPVVARITAPRNFNPARMSEYL